MSSTVQEIDLVFKSVTYEEYTKNQDIYFPCNGTSVSLNSYIPEVKTRLLASINKYYRENYFIDMNDASMRFASSAPTNNPIDGSISEPKNVFNDRLINIDPTNQFISDPGRSENFFIEFGKEDNWFNFYLSAVDIQLRLPFDYHHDTSVNVLKKSRDGDPLKNTEVPIPKKIQIFGKNGSPNWRAITKIIDIEQDEYNYLVPLHFNLRELRIDHTSYSNYRIVVWEWNTEYAATYENYLGVANIFCQFGNIIVHSENDQETVSINMEAEEGYNLVVIDIRPFQENITTDELTTVEDDNVEDNKDVCISSNERVPAGFVEVDEDENVPFTIESSPWEVVHQQDKIAEDVIKLKVDLVDISRDVSHVKETIENMHNHFGESIDYLKSQHSDERISTYVKTLVTDILQHVNTESESPMDLETIKVLIAEKCEEFKHTNTEELAQLVSIIEKTKTNLLTLQNDITSVHTEHRELVITLNNKIDEFYAKIDAENSQITTADNKILDVLVCEDQVNVVTEDTNIKNNSSSEYVVIDDTSDVINIYLPALPSIGKYLSITNFKKSGTVLIIPDEKNTISVAYQGNYYNAFRSIDLELFSEKATLVFNGVEWVGKVEPGVKTK